MLRYLASFAWSGAALAFIVVAALSIWGGLSDAHAVTALWIITALLIVFGRADFQD